MTPPIHAGEMYAGWVDMSSPERTSGGVSVDASGCQVWWCGFLANRSALVAELAHGETGWSDERLVTQAYRRWGAMVQAHLLGEYALAIFDREAHSLLLTHDALGVRPLYYAARPPTVYFGTHLSLLATTLSDLDLDESYLAEYLLRGECLGERTIYRGITRLGVGRTMRYGAARGTGLQTWWLGDIPELRYRDPRDYDEHFRELLQQAVSAAVQGRSWSELSGGLDSSTIVCMARRLGIEDFETISVVYPKSTSSDESAWIDIVREATGLPGHLVDGDERPPFSELPDRLVDEPSRLHITWPVFRQYEEILSANGVDVLLTGLGGDQVLFGDKNHPIHLADYLRRFRLVSAVREAAQWDPNARQRSLTHGLLTDAVMPAWSYLRGRPVSYHHDSAFPRRCSWVCQDFIRRTGADETSTRAPAPRIPTVRGQAYYEHLWRMACGFGKSWAQNTTVCSWRYPLLYRPLVEFMYALPWMQQVTAGRDRVLQRRALAGVLPEQTRSRRTKSGPDQAICEGLRTNRDAVELLTRRPQIVERGYVDEAAWRSAVGTARFGYVSPLSAFEAAVCLELWLRQQS